MHYKKLSLVLILFLSLSMLSSTIILTTNAGIKPIESPVYDNTLNLKTSTTFNITISINDLPGSLNNWTWAKAQGYCTGSGTTGDPYLINNHLFKSTFGYCLEIFHSRKHFRVLNCDFMISIGLVGAIFLFNTTNGLIEDNQMPYFTFGIDINNCTDITLRDNNCSLGTFGFLIQNSKDLSFISNDVERNSGDGYPV